MEHGKLTVKSQLEFDANTKIELADGYLKFIDVSNPTGKTLEELSAGGDHGEKVFLHNMPAFQYIQTHLTQQYQQQ